MEVEIETSKEDFLIGISLTRYTDEDLADIGWVISFGLLLYSLNLYIQDTE